MTNIKAKFFALGLAVLVPLAPAAAQVPAATPAQRNPAAEAFISDNITKGLAILNDTTLTPAQRSDQFQALLLHLTDAKRISAFVLGPYAEKATAAEKDAFATAFESYSVAVYRSYLGRFSGQSLTVTGSSQRAPDDVIVFTRLDDPHARSGQIPLVVNFRVRTDAGRPEVTDLNVLGVWLALSERDGFVSYLNAHGGSVAALTDYVMQVASQLSAPAAAAH